MKDTQKKKKKEKTATEICFWAPEAHFKPDNETVASYMRVYYQRTATESYALDITRSTLHEDTVQICK